MNILTNSLRDIKNVSSTRIVRGVNGAVHHNLSIGNLGYNIGIDDKLIHSFKAMDEPSFLLDGDYALRSSRIKVDGKYIDVVDSKGNKRYFLTDKVNNLPRHKSDTLFIFKIPNINPTNITLTLATDEGGKRTWVEFEPLAIVDGIHNHKSFVNVLILLSPNSSVMVTHDSNNTKHVTMINKLKEVEVIIVQ